MTWWQWTLVVIAVAAIVAAVAARLIWPPGKRHLRYPDDRYDG